VKEQEHQGMNLKWERKYLNGSKLTIKINCRRKEEMETEYKLALKVWEEFEQLRQKYNWFV